MSDELSGKTAIITGAASAIGRAIAWRFAEAGARVMLADEGEDPLNELQDRIGEDGHEVSHFHFDRRDRLSAANLIAATFDAFGALDILVNDSQPTSPGSFLELDTAVLRDAIEQNLMAPFVLSKAVAKRMAVDAAKDADFTGSIVNITSVAAQRTVPGLMAYSISCAALDQLTRSMAASLAEHRIRVNGVALGGVISDRMIDLLREDDEFREDLVQSTPLGRTGEPEEAADAALYLASSRAGFVTGQILAVDGGRLVLDPFTSAAR